MSKILYLVIPCYNEEQVLPLTKKELKEKMSTLIKSDKISKDSKVMFVNDGSKDKTWDLIEEYHNEDNLFVGIKLSRNKGHQNALLAGLMTAKKYADITISMDADLQDDINVIDKMIEENNKGAEIVYGVRSSRKKDSWFKRFTAESFYKLMRLMGVEVVFNQADCRLMSKRVLDELEHFDEVNLFLRGIVPLIGFKTSIATYERNKRVAGESKYPLKKMISFALDGITSFSIKPLHYITYLGVVFILISIAVIIYALISYFDRDAIQGWTSLLISVWFIGGCILIACGVIGEYVGKIYIETKRRPLYFIEKTAGISNK